MTTLTLLTQQDCVWCDDAKTVLAELSTEFDLQIEEVDLNSDRGQYLAADHHLMFTPGLIAQDRLIAHGRLSKRALRRDLTRLTNTD